MPACTVPGSDNPVQCNYQADICLNDTARSLRQPQPDIRTTFDKTLGTNSQAFKTIPKEQPFKKQPFEKQPLYDPRPRTFVEENPMKRIKLGVLLIVAALSIIAVSSAALSSISLNRSVQAGAVLVDTTSGVAIQFTAMNNYDAKGVFITNSNGEISFNLKQAVASNDVLNGWNTAGHFLIGSQTTPVFAISNNSDLPVTVHFNDSASQAVGVVTLVGSTTIAAGASQTYYYDINTTISGVSTTAALEGTIEVRGGSGLSPVFP